MLSVLIAADVRIHRDEIARALTAGGHQVVGAFASRAEALAQVSRLRPRVAVVDLPHADRGTFAWQVGHGAPDVSVVVIGVEDVLDVIALAEAGAAACLPKDGTEQDLVATVEAAARGESLCSPRVAGALMHRLAIRGQPYDDGLLTMRESQIAGLIAQGLSNKEIAEHLCIATSTVKNHVHRILVKLGVRRRGQAAARLGFVDGLPHARATVERSIARAV